MSGLALSIATTDDPTEPPTNVELEDMRSDDRDDAHQPLMARVGADYGHNTEDNERDEATSTRQRIYAKRGINRVLWLLTLNAGLSGLLFGYEFVIFP